MEINSDTIFCGLNGCSKAMLDNSTQNGFTFSNKVFDSSRSVSLTLYCDSSEIEAMVVKWRGKGGC